MDKGKVDIELIRRYFKGELSSREMHVLERRAENDPAWMDVMLGMEQEADDVHAANLVDIRGRLSARTRRGRLRRLIPAQRWAIAATILVALTFGALWLLPWRSPEPMQEVASTPLPKARSSGRSAQKTPEAETEQAPQVEMPSTTDEAAIQKSKRLASQSEKEAFSTDTSDEIAVVGYGTQKKKELTGATAQVEPFVENTDEPIHAEKSDTVADLNEQLLAGRVAGGRLADSRAEDSPAPVRIRGFRRDTKPAVIRGKIVDSETQTPLIGAAVQLSDNQTLITDSLGAFTLSDSINIRNASLLGYELHHIKTVGRDSVVVMMKPKDVSLSEIVVVGSDDHKRSNRKKSEQPAPLDGWRAFNRYLRQRIKESGADKGTVTLTFTISDNGFPVDIRVIQTTDPKLNKRAIEFVQDGPKWEFGKNTDRIVELKVKF